MLIGWHYLSFFRRGLRVGECLVLKYNDIDFLHNTIRVDESCVHMILKEPKAQHVKRTIPVPEKVMSILKN